VKRKPTFNFGSPELTDHDGTPIDVPDLLAERLSQHIGRSRQDCSLFDELNPILAQAIRSAAAKIAVEPLENAIVLSPDGAVVSKSLGNRNRVGIDSRLIKNTAFVHNHPEGTPLSDSDIQALFETEVSSVWAVGGEWIYGASLGSKGSGPTVLGDLKVAYGYLSKATFAIISDRFRHGTGIDESTLEIIHQHVVLSELAVAGFIRYCRFKYGT
jgi:hypothetical protein